MYRDCTLPVTSYGIIAYRRFRAGDQISTVPGTPYDCDVHNSFINTRSQTLIAPRDGDLVYCMIQRKDTHAYIDFIRGIYSTPQLMTLFGEMTCQERHRLLHESFDEIWNRLWVNHKNPCYTMDYDEAKAKYTSVDKHYYIKHTHCTWPHTEFGFPKGRRNVRESTLNAALREYTEETGTYTTSPR
ncbi:uncharacterized protein BJ171DRAFT_593493 [Polychytrium aggregatum]|uniref:uncharacterized protein n=1 Tax=Polychytrium aggregatum TaxID=110093 RepID=UPI0022FE740D|nr:uncharacterized protein BJ171DRAFT_593493 [Polychytrium aggregatum]KAI9187547.1 hypothetical protein BJ171DRAFT_593493 [Polychytrium aggregatum]